MLLENSLKKIKNYFVSRYKDNLASVVLFGSVVTGKYVEGKSDIDTIVLLKKKENLNLDEEKKRVFEERTEKNLSIQNLMDLKYAKENLVSGKSWSTYWALASEKGSRILYSTPEFKSLKKYLLKNPPKRGITKLHTEEKDKVDLEKLLPNWKEFTATKYLMFHIRRKLQVLNYFKNKSYVYDFDECFKNLEFSKEMTEDLKNLTNYYNDKKPLSKEEISYYVKLSYNLTEKIEKEI